MFRVLEYTQQQVGWDGGISSLKNFDERMVVRAIFILRITIQISLGRLDRHLKL